MALRFVVPGRLIPVRHQHDLEQVRRSAGQVGGLAGLGAPELQALAEAVTAMGTALADGSGGWVSVRDLGTVGGPGVEATAFGRTGGEVAPTWSRFPASVPDDGQAYVTGLVADSGDVGGTHGWRAWHGPTGVGILVCAAAGNGPEAALLLERALSVPVVTTPRATLRVLHGRLAGTPGVAAAAVEIDVAARTVRTAAVGDLTVDVRADAVPITPTARAGRVGQGSAPPLRRADEVTVGWSRELSLVVHTAGIAGIDALDGADVAAHPSLLCARLMQDHRRAGEDACVVAARVALP